MHTSRIAGAALAVTLSACAGRSPQPVAVVQPQDQFTDCTAIMAEVEANNRRVQELASEEGLKTSPLGSRASLFQYCGSGWISRVQQAKRSLHYKADSNISHPWQHSGVTSQRHSDRDRMPTALASRPVMGISLLVRLSW
jgi:hypothetical protein